MLHDLQTYRAWSGLPQSSRSRLFGLLPALVHSLFLSFVSLPLSPSLCLSFFFSLSLSLSLSLPLSPLSRPLSRSVSLAMKHGWGGWLFHVLMLSRTAAMIQYLMLACSHLFCIETHIHTNKQSKQNIYIYIYTHIY